MYSGTIPRAEIPLAKPTVHPKHPFRDPKSHEALLGYITPRLDLGKTVRDDRLERMVRTDKNIAGWMKLTDEDRERLRTQDTTGVPQALTVNLPLNFVQMDDMMTYYAQTFSPNRGMFYQMGKPDEADVSGQIVTVMNNHAIYGGYFRQTLLTLFSTLKYNLGGFCVEWQKDSGPKLGKDDRGADVLTSEIIWQGNRCESLNMYNTFWDPMVAPSDLYRLGEWCARADLISHYTLQRLATDGLYFNCEDMLREDAGTSSAKYYVNPPDEAKMSQAGKGDTGGGGTNWLKVLGGLDGYASATGYERVQMYIRLNPIQMNLLPKDKATLKSRNRMEVWRITLLNGNRIIEATYMSNMHGYLPFFIGAIHDDQMEEAAKSPAEMIQPLQDFASFLMNTHVRATRKNIWGLTVYDPSVVDLGQVPAGEVAAKIPSRPGAAGKSVREAIYEHDKNLDTKQTMQDLESVMNIISVFFPTTSMPSQIASIDRAVDSQVAAVQQGANRRMQKGARLLDDSMFRPMRFALYYNIIQFQPDNANVSDFYGRSVKVDLTQLRNTDLPFIIGQGLKMIDRQAAAQQIQQVIFALIQNPLTAQQFDLPALIDYWTSMIDVDIDMKTFRLQPPGMGHNGAPPGQLPGDEATAAAQPGVVPATDPAAMTEPLRG